jgi:3-oxoacyl-[acyl-carrier-protein] synthase-3
MVASCESARPIVQLTIARLNREPTMENFKRCVATLTGGSGAVAVVLTDGRTGTAGHRLAGGVVRNAVVHHGLCRWGMGMETENPIHDAMRMDTDAPSVLEHGVVLGRETYQDFIAAIGWPTGSPDKVVCHQVGATHQTNVLQAIGIDKKRDFSTFAFLGNIGTVSLPITAAIGAERGFFTPGDRVGFFGIGSGLNCILMGVEW